MRLAALRKLIFSKRDRQEYIRENLNRIWNCLLAEYGLPLTTEFIIVDSYNLYPKEAARRLAALGYKTDSKTDDEDDYKAKSENLDKPLMMTQFCYPVDETGVIVPKCVGVYCMWEGLYRYLKYDSKSELDLKFRCIECLMRHEIGHVLSMDWEYRGMTVTEVRSKIASIDEATDKLISSWEAGKSLEDQLRRYYQLPLEIWANESAHIDVDTLIDAYDILRG